LAFVLFNKVGLLKSRAEAGGGNAEAALKFLPKTGARPGAAKNSEAPQHWG
jgi:hypothetical protein